MCMGIPALVRGADGCTVLMHTLDWGPGMTMFSWRPSAPCPCLAAPPADMGARTLSALPTCAALQRLSPLWFRRLVAHRWPAL